MFALCAVCAIMMTKELIAVAKNTTVNLRVDSEVKEEAGEILASMGLTFSEAFNLMLHQICLQHALPFKVVAYVKYKPYDAETGTHSDILE